MSDINVQEQEAVVEPDEATQARIDERERVLKYVVNDELPEDLRERDRARAEAIDAAIEAGDLSHTGQLRGNVSPTREEAEAMQPDPVAVEGGDDRVNA